MTARHRTHRGREFNMTAFAEKNADARAVGNVPMNARGDIVDSKGNVKISAKQIAKGQSAVNNNKVTRVSLKEDSEAAPVKNDSVKPDTAPPQPAAQEKPARTPRPMARPAPKPVASPEPEQVAPSKIFVKEITEVKRRIIETAEGDMIEIEYSDGSMEMIKVNEDDLG